MIRAGLLLVVVVLSAGCLRASERVRRVASPESDPSFMTRCKHAEQCLADAKEVCPGGYLKVSLEGDTREKELVFKCHGNPNW